MDEFKEFQGNTLDAAIQDACLYFNLDREKLEIEIVQDAKSGIFGIVWGRKARVRARRAHLSSAVQSVLGELESRPQEKAQAQTPKEARQEQPSTGRRQPRAETQRQPQQPARSRASGRQKPAAAAKSGPERPAKGKGQPAQAAPEKKPRKPAASRSGEVLPAEDTDGQGFRAMEESDFSAVKEAALDIVSRLLRPLVDSVPPMEATVSDGTVSISVQAPADEPSALIGQDGSALAAVQYLAGRLVSRRLELCARIHLDVGDYRQRQEDELTRNAAQLAEKVLQAGHALTTRPLSSSERRIVHLFLKGREGIQTRSTGEGGLKRVLITRKKSGQNQRRQQDADKPQ